MSTNFSLRNSLKNRTIVLIGLAAFLLTASLVVASRRTHEASVATAPANHGPELIAGPGNVEPWSEDIKIGSELSGKLKSVNVEEGDSIRRGQVLAVLENDDYLAQVRSAEAQALTKQAALRKVINGARTQERAEAFSSATEAQAVLDNARSEMERREKLYAAGVISREE